MYVGLQMIKDVPTITPSTLVVEADRIMEENQVWLLLVLDQDRLMGYVRKEDVRSALPSSATTLSRHELNYVLGSLTVKELIKKDVPVVRPETEIEVAAEMMHHEGLSGLPVVDAEGKLVGYVNRTAMLSVLVEEMGLGLGGERVAIEVLDRTGVMADVTGIVTDMGGNIVSMSTFYRNEKRLMVFRITADNVEEVKNALEDQGYHIIGPEHFAHEWK